MATMIPRFLVGVFAGALASFFPRLVAVLGGDPERQRGAVQQHLPAGGRHRRAGGGCGGVDHRQRPAAPAARRLHHRAGRAHAADGRVDHRRHRAQRGAGRPEAADRHPRVGQQEPDPDPHRRAVRHAGGRRAPPRWRRAARPGDPQRARASRRPPRPRKPTAWASRCASRSSSPCTRRPATTRPCGRCSQCWHSAGCRAAPCSWPTGAICWWLPAPSRPTPTPCSTAPAPRSSVRCRTWCRRQRLNGRAVRSSRPGRGRSRPRRRPRNASRGAAADGRARRATRPSASRSCCQRARGSSTSTKLPSSRWNSSRVNGPSVSTCDSRASNEPSSGSATRSSSCGRT